MKKGFIIYVIFVVGILILKATGILTLGWGWVFAPVWIPVGLLIIVFGLTHHVYYDDMDYHYYDDDFFP